MNSSGRKTPRSLYYITHIKNLPSIVEKGILSHELVEREGIDFTPIYDRQIVGNRKNKTVDGKSLWRFANFFFQPRNPMLYRVVREKGCDNIAIVAVRRKLMYMEDVYVTDGNAASSGTRFYVGTDVRQMIQKIYQEIAEKERWSDVDYSKRKIMAECLVPERVPPEDIESVYVCDHSTQEKVKSLLGDDHLDVIPEPYIFFEPDWKYDLTENLSLVRGDLFFSRLQTLTISVNTVGVMGKGLASHAKYQFPDVYVYYQDLCKSRKLRMGHPVLFKRETPYDPLVDMPSSLAQSGPDTWFLLFPTKRHWRERSDIIGIEDGLKWLLANYKASKISSLAIPALGCGLGRLNWRDVGPILCKYLSKMEIPVWIYLPSEQKLSPDLLTEEFLLAEGGTLPEQRVKNKISDY